MPCDHVPEASWEGDCKISVQHNPIFHRLTKPIRQAASSRDPAEAPKSFMQTKNETYAQGWDVLTNEFGCNHWLSWELTYSKYPCMIDAHRCNHKLQQFGGYGWSHALLWTMIVLTSAAPRSAARPASNANLSYWYYRFQSFFESYWYEYMIMWFVCCLCCFDCSFAGHIFGFDLIANIGKHVNSAKAGCPDCQSLLAWCLVAPSQFLAAPLAAGPWKCEDETESCCEEGDMMWQNNQTSISI